MYGFSADDWYCGPRAEIGIGKHAYVGASILWLINREPDQRGRYYFDGIEWSANSLNGCLEIGYRNTFSPDGPLGFYYGLSAFLPPRPNADDSMLDVLFMMVYIPASWLQLDCGLSLSL